eukprot:6529980-Alexandrium_andersonii.AAC.1
MQNGAEPSRGGLACRKLRIGSCTCRQTGWQLQESWTDGVVPQQLECPTTIPVGRADNQSRGGGYDPVST